MTVLLKWKRCGSHTLPVPTRANVGDAGLDLPVVVDKDTEPVYGSFSRTLGEVPVLDVYNSSGLIVFRTGWAVEIPPGYYGQIVVRSSVGKAGWDIESSGVIDSSYRGEIKMPLIYRGEETGRVEHGRCLAQMLILPVPHIECVEVDALSDTARGEGGFGSTGK